MKFPFDRILNTLQGNNRKIILVMLIPCISFLFNCSIPKTEKEGNRPVDLVYPFLDTANSRWFFFSSACRPFGMVNLSPDTQIDGDWGTGYRYNTDTVKGFSHVHAWQLAALSVMPVNHGSKAQLIKNDYYSSFSHKSEIAKPGYHQLFLDRYNIKAELTSTTRVGFHRYTFPTDNGSFLVKLGGQLGTSKISDGKIMQVSNRKFTGYVVNAPNMRRSKECPVFFVIEFSEPVSNIEGWIGDESFNNIAELSGKNAGVLFSFDKLNEKKLLVKVGISYSNTEQAELNLKNELDHWNFDQVVEDSQNEWNRMLSRILVEGGTTMERRRFYTDLWHALQGRRIISDVSGSYSDYTRETRRIGQLPLGEYGKPLFNHFNSDGFWGAQWTLNTLWHLVYPEISSQFCNSFLQYYKDGGLIPRGPSGGNYTFVMVGASTTPFYVSAWMKGIRNFDIKLAYEGLKKNHLPGGLMSKAGYEHNTNTGGGIEHYMKNGFVPYPIPEESNGMHKDGAGMTLDYAYQDWCLAQLAQNLGKTNDYNYFTERSSNWKNLFDPSTGWIRPKNIDRNWKEPFDPFEYENGFVEANAAQSTWYVPHDPAGLSQLMGGNEKMAHRLDSMFRIAEKLGFTSGTSHAQELHKEYKRIPINYGNQPSTQTAAIFNSIGRPDLSQYWTKKVANTIFSGLTPETGYNGDEDQGMMGSLAVLMKIGLFELDGGCSASPQYSITAPAFDRVIIKLNPEYYPGKEFRIVAINRKENHFYIKSATFNNQELNGVFIKHADVVNGGDLQLELTDKY
jgi:predicted alpha-1,2-mannosidase